MATINYVRLKGIVLKDPMIVKKEGERPYVRAQIVVSRGLRKVDNGITYMMTDRPYLISTEENVVSMFESVKDFDIIDVTGVITTRSINKTSRCPGCGAKHTESGVLTFVTPVFIEKTGHIDDEDMGLEYLSSIRPISNQVKVFGRLTRDPKKVIPKSGLVVTQYQIALLRSLTIKEDSPEIRVDYPWVKVYGARAEDEHLRLMNGSIVHLDGYLQTRIVNKHAVCEGCGTKFDWADKAMEIVPYATEYVENYRSDEEIAEEKQARIEQAKRDFHKKLSGGVSDEITEQDVADGMDDLKNSGL